MECLRCSSLGCRDTSTAAVIFVSTLWTWAHNPSGIEEMRVTAAKTADCSGDPGDCILEGHWQDCTLASPVIEDW
jgi:hypothetical protein